MRRDRGRLFWSSSMTVSVNHIRFVLLLTHAHWMHQNTIHCITFTLHWLWKPVLIQTYCITDRFFFFFFLPLRQLSDTKCLLSGLGTTDERHKSNSGVHVNTRISVSTQGFAYPCTFPVSQLHPFTLHQTPQLLCTGASTATDSRLLRGFSNENHSSQSSLPETKGQCNLGKIAGTPK